MDAQAYLAERTPLVDGLLEELLPAATAAPVALHRAMRHLIFPGGKRLRPALAMAGAEAAGGPPEAALPVAAAVELVHTYSLIHDDLPCMDDDSVRRGRPTVHVAYGEAVALLAGDALLALAFESLAGRASDPGHATRVVGELALAAGSAGLVGGQVDDLGFCHDRSDRSDRGDAAAVESVHARKTAALMVASIAGGACLGGADDALVRRLRDFGRALGVAFQIADDLLDEGDDDACSMLRALGVGPARERAESLLARALSLLEGLGERAEPLRALAHFAVRRDV